MRILTLPDWLWPTFSIYFSLGLLSEHALCLRSTGQGKWHMLPWDFHFLRCSSFLSELLLFPVHPMASPNTWGPGTGRCLSTNRIFGRLPSPKSSFPSESQYVFSMKLHPLRDIFSLSFFLIFWIAPSVWNHDGFWLSL